MWHIIYGLTRLRKTTGDTNYYAPLERGQTNLLNAIRISCYKPFGTCSCEWTLGMKTEYFAELIMREPMVLLLDLWTGFILAILYLAFESMPKTFSKHGFNSAQLGLSFLGIGVGICLSLVPLPFILRYVKPSTSDTRAIY
jgi:hypothetical protein